MQKLSWLVRTDHIKKAILRSHLIDIPASYPQIRPDCNSKDREDREDLDLDLDREPRRRKRIEEIVFVGEIQEAVPISSVLNFALCKLKHASLGIGSLSWAWIF